MATPKTEQYWRLDDMLMARPNGIALGDLRKATEGGAIRANTRTATWLLKDNAVIAGLVLTVPSANGTLADGCWSIFDRKQFLPQTME